MNGRMVLVLPLGVFFILFSWNNYGFLSALYRAPAGVSWDVLRVLPGHARNVFLAFYLVAAFYGIGSIVLRRLKFERGMWLSQLFAFSVGTVVAELCLFSLGMAGALSIRDVKYFTVLLLPAGVYGLWRLQDFLRQHRRHTTWKSPSAVRLIGYGALLYGLGHSFLYSLAPPTEWDVISYHLVIPKLYLAGSKIQEIPWLLHSQWPHVMELLYTVPLAWSAEGAAAFLHLFFALATAGAVYAIGREQFNERVAFLAALLFVAQPIFLRYSGTAHADAAWTFFTFMSLLSVWRWASGKEIRWAAAGGILMGLAMSAKLLSLLWFMPLAIWMGCRPGARSDSLRASGVFSLCAVLLAFPWYLKSWLWAGNPVWPFGSRYLGGLWGARLLEIPYRATFTWQGWPRWDWLKEQEGYYVLIPGLAAAALSLWNRLKWPPVLRFLGLLALPYLLVLFHHTDFWRLLWPALPSFALGLAWSADQLWRRFTKSRPVVALLLAVALWPLCSASQNNVLFPVSGMRSISYPHDSPREAYLLKALNIYAGCRKANTALSRSDKVLLFREMRGYYLDVPFMWGDPINQALIVYPLMRDEEDLYSQLESLGITHVFINDENYVYDFHTTSLMEDMLTHHGRQVFSEGSVTLYQLHPGNAH